MDPGVPEMHQNQSSKSVRVRPLTRSVSSPGTGNGRMGRRSHELQEQHQKGCRGAVEAPPRAASHTFLRLDGALGDAFGSMGGGVASFMYKIKAVFIDYINK